jgi:serine/threonine-protein kinase
MRADGVGRPQALTESKNSQVPYSFTPDGKRLAWDELDSTGFHVVTMDVTNTGEALRGGKPEVFFQTTDAHAPTFSPDGHWLAYMANESGDVQTYVRAFPDNGGKWQISMDGGTFPRWSRNGRELFFNATGRIMVATYTAKGDSFVADPPRIWSPGILGGQLDVAPDGKRVVAPVSLETLETQRAPSHIVFLLNFYDELRRKVPVQ